MNVCGYFFFGHSSIIIIIIVIIIFIVIIILRFCTIPGASKVDNQTSQVMFF